MHISTVLEQIRNGNLALFGSLYDASYEKIYAFVYHRTLDDIDTQDIVSDVYMKALKSIGSFRWSTEWEFFSWIYRIAYTTLIDSTRWTKHTDSIEENELDPGFEINNAESVDNKSKLEEILTFMDTFSERDRLILTMRIWDDLSYDEIAIITGESVSNAKKIVSRSLAKISANIAHLFILSFALTYVTTR